MELPLEFRLPLLELLLDVDVGLLLDLLLNLGFHTLDVDSGSTLALQFLLILDFELFLEAILRVPNFLDSLISLH